MYCSSCGGAVARALTYCNHCGTKLGGFENDRSEGSDDKYRGLLVSAIVGGMIGGLGVIIGLLAVMKEVARLEPGIIIAFTALSFFLLFAVETVLITQLIRHQRSREGSSKEESTFRQPNTKELESGLPRALPDHVPSVTEHTTRAFEPVFSERKSK